MYVTRSMYIVYIEMYVVDTSSINVHLLFQKLEAANILNIIDPDKTPNFLMEIILTHIIAHYEDYEDFVSHEFLCCWHYTIDYNVTGYREFNSITASSKETHSL